MTSIANPIPAIGLGTFGRTGDAGMASILVDEPEKLDCNLNIPPGFANLGVTSRHFDWLVGQALADRSNPTGLSPPGGSDCRNVLSQPLWQRRG
jgi:alcohol dehydrogenase class IV